MAIFITDHEGKPGAAILPGGDTVLARDDETIADFEERIEAMQKTR